MRILVTQEILDKYPDLINKGVQLGQEIETADFGLSLEDKPNENDSQSFDEDPPTGGGSGGERPPTGPRRP